MWYNCSNCVPVIYSFFVISGRNGCAVHILKSKPKFGKNTGLTLNELIVVLVVIAVSAAVAIPAMIGFIRHGQQVNRMNVARTLYVAMQGQLTRAITEGNLRVVLTDGFYHRDASGELVIDEDYFELIADDFANEYFGRVAHRLGDCFPDEDEENEDYVFFISKPAGFVRSAPGGAVDTPVDKFYDLLSEVIIDTEILNDAILMEFNIRTGVVMSIFYGDHNPMWFQPGPRANSRHFVYDVDNDIDNVIGSRGMDDGGYAFASVRRQGYFGVNYTGELPPLPIDDIVRIFDGMDFDDELGYGHGLNIGTLGDRRVNILFAEFLLIRPLADGDGRILAIFDDYDGAELITMTSPFAQRQLNFEAALIHSQIGNNHAIYQSDDPEFTFYQFGINVAGVFSRYIWVLDYIEGDTFEQPHNITIRYGINEPLNLRARVSEYDGASTDSFMLANSHFATELPGGEFEVRSVRHLNNVRYFLDESFVQTAHIDMDTLMPVSPSITNLPNFMPIGLFPGGASAPFTGTYNAVRGEHSQWRIENLVIDINTMPSGFTSFDAGLFSEVGGIAAGGLSAEGTVVGVSLFGAQIHAPVAENVGAVVGTVRSGGRVARSNSFSNVTGGVGNTGGLVGRIDSGGELTYSFNAGFFNTHPREDMPIEDSTATANGFGSVSAGLLGYGGGAVLSNVNIGGLVGSNAGTIRMSFNNARVNIVDVELSDEPWWFSMNPTYIHVTNPESTFLGGIAGENAGTITHTYATNFVAMYQSGNSGGITGRNIGTGSVTRSHFITNGHMGSELITKEDLMHLNLTAAPVGFVSNQNARTEYLSEASAHFPKNIFDRYPYPRLANNNPFADIQYYFDEGLLSQFWGWEDIDAGGEFWLVYFELYSNGAYGLSPNTGIPGAEPLRNDLPIREAGYMLIAITEGGSVPATFQLYVRPGNISVTVPWSDAHRYVYLFGEDSIVFNEGGSNLAGTDELRAFYHKLDLAALENLMGTNRNIPLRFATSNDLIPSDPSDIDADELSLVEGFVHPLFARALLVTDDITAFNSAVTGGDGQTHNLPVYEIRTPWQMQNIDRVNTGTEATWIPPTPGGGVAIPPDIPPGGATYANMGTISKGVTWGTTNIGGTPIGVGSAPAVPVEVRVSAVLQNTNPPGSVTESLSGNRTINASELNASTNRVTLSNGYITLVGDFSGINIQHSGWGSLTLGSDSVPFVSQNPASSPAHIHSAVPLYIHVSNGMVLDNAVVANAAGANMTFTSTNASGTGITATMNARFYSTSSISGHIAVANWNPNTLPQFYTANEFRTLTVTGSAHMSGVFFARGLANIVFPGVTRFSGLIYSATNDIILGSNLTTVETIPIPNIDIIPTLPGTGVLDPAVEAYLVDRGWQFPDGGTNGGGEAGRWELGIPALAFRQTRNISFRVPDSGNPTGDIGGVPGQDGTTPIAPFPSNAVVRELFSGIFDGQNNTISNVNITATTGQANGLFALNDGTIRYLTLSYSDIGILGNAGSQSVGGIVGRNRGTIQMTTVRESRIHASEAPGSAVGGIAGENQNILELSSVQFSTVHGSGADMDLGGIAGRNDGSVRDIFFLSVADLDTPPVSNIGGGIVGHNNGVVERTLYLAPAPRSNEIAEDGAEIVMLYPIVRSGVDAATTTITTDLVTREFPLNFYLHGHRHRYRHVAGWTPWEPGSRYNLTSNVPEHITRVSGGGRGLVTEFVDLPWLNMMLHAGFTQWRQPPIGYPYPIIVGMPTPLRWAEADSPERPDQVDREDWAHYDLTDDRARAPVFVNADFSMGDFTLSQVNDMPSGSRRIYIDMTHVPGWLTRPVTAADFTPTFTGNQGNPSPSWRLIELMDPRNHGTGELIHEYAYSNHEGNWNNPNQILTSRFRYAELNAEIQGTLFQVLDTTPGQQFYYSFFHTSRTNLPLPAGVSVRADRLDFYLSGFIGGTLEVVNPAQLAARDGALTMIRPAVSPRTQRTTVVPGVPSFAPGTTTAINSTAWNASAWNTVAYGASNQGLPTATGTSGGPFDLSYHRGRYYVQPYDGQMRVQDIPLNHHLPGSTPIFLYDVWVGDTSGTLRNGFGITFWHTSSLTATGTTLTATNIPLAGITQYQFENGTAAWLTAARRNVIGFWGVEYGWKHFYGIYEVPPGQVMTEFAFQSRRVDATNGNFLSGISFNAPAFLSVNNFIRDEHDNDVSFVKPGNSLTVVTYIRNLGEISANNIVVTNQLYPFEEYLDFVPDSVLVTIDDTPVSVAVSSDVGITLPAGQQLHTDEVLRVTFQLRVRETVRSTDVNDDGDGVDTFLYFFRNQAVVTYREVFGQFGAVTNSNSSEPIQVAIDPVSLSKTVTPLIDGPFEVTMRVENVLEGGVVVNTDGLIDDLIPPGFRITSPVSRRVDDTGNFEPVAYNTVNEPGGYTRIIIPNVSLGEAVRIIEFRYTMEYVGAGYGVSRVHVASAHRYLYSDPLFAEDLYVMRSFPHSVVGITVRTQDDSFTVLGDITHVLDITANDNFAERLADDNYDVTPQVVLTDADGNPASINPITGNFEIETDYFRAALIRGTYNVEFTPLGGARGEFMFHYRILLTAGRDGGIEFNLDSRITTVTVTVGDSAAIGSAGYYLSLDDGDGDVAADGDDDIASDGDGGVAADVDGDVAADGNDGGDSSASDGDDDVGANVDVGDVLIVTGFAFGGGFGISRIRKFKLFMRRLDARTAHKINLHNERKRGR